MPAAQKQFDEFHAAIKFDNDDEKATCPIWSDVE
jgi:hypothetical protein